MPKGKSKSTSKGKRAGAARRAAASAAERRVVAKEKEAPVMDRGRRPTRESNTPTHPDPGNNPGNNPGNRRKYSDQSPETRSMLDRVDMRKLIVDGEIKRVKELMEMGYDIEESFNRCWCCPGSENDVSWAMYLDKFGIFNLFLRYIDFNKIKIVVGDVSNIHEGHLDIKFLYAILDETITRGENTDFIYKCLINRIHSKCYGTPVGDGEHGVAEMVRCFQDIMLGKKTMAAWDIMMTRYGGGRRRRIRACVKIQSVIRMYLCAKRVNSMRCEPCALFDDEFGATRRRMLDVREDLWTSSV